MTDTSGYARKTRRSLLQREMTAGVPERGIVLLFMLAVVFVYGMKMIFMIGPVILLYIIMKALSAKDPYMIDIVLDNVQQKDVLLP